MLAAALSETEGLDDMEPLALTLDAFTKPQILAAFREVLASTEALRVAKPRVVRTCRAVSDDLEPSGPTHPPTLPAGTYGVACESDDDDFAPVDFGPPWGVQRIGNHCLVDAAAVLLTASRSITLFKRPWRAVMRRTLRTFAGPFLRVVVAEHGFHNEQSENAAPGSPSFAVEAWMYAKGTRKRALKMLDRAAEIARGKAVRK